MNNSTCCPRNNCVLFAVIISIIVGIASALLRFSAVITVTPAILWVFFGISAAYLFASPFITVFFRCVCIGSLLPFVLTALIGTILTSLVLLTITFVATSVAGAIITGALAAFFTLTVTSTACLATCVCSTE